MQAPSNVSSQQSNPPDSSENLDEGHSAGSLAVVPAEAKSHAFEPNSLGQAFRISKMLVASGLLPKALNTPEAACAVIICGRELGLTMMQSVRSIHIIEGKPSLSADLMVALVKRSPLCRYFIMVESTATSATYETQREGQPGPERLTFTIEDAARAGLTGKDNWKKYPAGMLRARCKSGLARAVYEDALMGVGTPDERDEEVESMSHHAHVQPVVTITQVPAQTDRVAARTQSVAERVNAKNERSRTRSTETNDPSVETAESAELDSMSES